MHARVSLALLLCSLAGAMAQAQSVSVTIDPASPGRIFDGFGAVSAGASSRLLYDYPEPYRSQVLDYLFRPHYGASLQHLKVEIGSDVNSTDGSEPSHMRTPQDKNFTRGYEWWLMQEAHRRNPKIILDTLAWGAPGWVGPGGTGKATLYTPAMAHYAAVFLNGAQSQYHLNIPYTGIWNETAVRCAIRKDTARRAEQGAARHKDRLLRRVSARRPRPMEHPRCHAQGPGARQGSRRRQRPLPAREGQAHYARRCDQRGQAALV